MGALGDMIAALPQFDALMGRRVLTANGCAELEQQANIIERDFEAWKAKLANRRAELRAIFDLPEVSRKDLRSMSTLIDVLDNKLSVDRIKVEEFKKEFRAIVRNAHHLSRADEEWAAGLARRVAKVLQNWHNERVRLYYEMIALRAEHDPEARGGPTFDSVDALLEHLKAAAA
jgi:chromosome segregation ATPase